MWTQRKSVLIVQDNADALAIFSKNIPFFFINFSVFNFILKNLITTTYYYSYIYTSSSVQI